MSKYDNSEYRVPARKLQEAFDKLFEVSERACDSDIDLSKRGCDDVMTELWGVLRETRGFYTGELPEWLKP